MLIIGLACFRGPLHGVGGKVDQEGIILTEALVMVQERK